MRARSLALAFALLAIFAGTFASGVAAQTPQPYLFAGTVTNSQYGLVTLQRDDAMGTLTALSPPRVTAAVSTGPQSIEPSPN